MSNNHGKKRTTIRRELALGRKTEYDKLTVEEKLNKAIPGTRQHNKLLGKLA